VIVVDVWLFCNINTMGSCFDQCQSQDIQSPSTIGKLYIEQVLAIMQDTIA